MEQKKQISITVGNENLVGEFGIVVVGTKISDEKFDTKVNFEGNTTLVLTGIMMGQLLLSLQDQLGQEQFKDVMTTAQYVVSQKNKGA